jgi:hypothetical protein
LALIKKDRQGCLSFFLLRNRKPCAGGQCRAATLSARTAGIFVVENYRHAFCRLTLRSATGFSQREKLHHQFD